MSLIFTSFTPITASGGVPRWNRDMMLAFPEAKHYSWWDVIADVGDVHFPMHEWDQAKILNKWLIKKKLVRKDDIVVTDGFWGLGLEEFPNVVSVCHGNWSHTTQDDVDAGILPEFPNHHREQVNYRRKHLARSGRMVAVSDFIADQCKIQWGFEMPVINNGIDLDVFKPQSIKLSRKRPVILHGVTNANKGFDHIQILKDKLNADILLLDDAVSFFNLPKYEALGQASIFTHPSAHEGNSYMLLESLACGVPIVSYNVGLMYWTKKNDWENEVGIIIDRKERSPEKTMNATAHLLSNLDKCNPRKFAEMFSIQRFHAEWKAYLKKEFNYDSSSSG